MKLQKDGVAMIVAKNLLHKLLTEEGAPESYLELEGIAERLLYNAYVEGYTEATKRISDLSFDLVSKGLPVRTEQMLLVGQIENTLWSR